MRPAKKSLLVLAVAASTVVPPALAETGPGPRSGTVDAMHCLTRQGTKGCETMFVGTARITARPWVFENPNRDFKRGPLVSSDYWGPASDSSVYDARILNHQPTMDMDIFDVKFGHVEYSFYISPADDAGKIHALAIRLYGPRDMHALEH